MESIRKTLRAGVWLLVGALGLSGLASGQGRDMSLEGAWRGNLDVGGGATLRVVFQLSRAADGTYTATLDSPDQGAFGIPVTSATQAGDSVHLRVEAILGGFDGVRVEENRLVGAWIQRGLSAPLTLERGSEDPTESASRPQVPRKPYPYREEEIRFPNAAAGIELAATLTLPEGPGPFPGVVLVTGSGPQDRNEVVMGHPVFHVLADHLTRRGIAVLRYDDRGVGGSGGFFATATTRDFAADAAAAAAYLRRRPEVGPVGVVGHSEGGLIAPIVANASEEVAFVALLAAPGVPGEDIVLLQAERILVANGAPAQRVAGQRALQAGLFETLRATPDSAEAHGLLTDQMTRALTSLPDDELAEMGIHEGNLDAAVRGQVEPLLSPWFRFFLAYDPRSELRRLTKPVLVLNGSLDLQVSPDQNLPEIEKALRSAGNVEVVVRELAGLNHLFQEAKTGSPAEYGKIEQTMSPKALELLADWVLARAR